MIRQLSRRQVLADVAFAVGAFVVFGLPGLLLGRAGEAETLVAAGLCLAIGFRRWCTPLALGVAWLTSIIEMAVGTWPVVAANLLVVIVLAATGAHQRRVVRWLGFASALLGAGCVTGYALLGPAWAPEQRFSSTGTLFEVGLLFSATAAVFLLAWTTGYVSRVLANGRAERAATQAAEREAAIEQERSRIARDMHDVVAHSLAVVIAQADGARYLREQDPAAVDAALAAIAATSREALTEVRELLAQLRHDQGRSPQPELDDLDRLYAQFRSAGLELRLHETGVPRSLRSASQRAAFRIVQESLTNALRHADTDEPVELGFDWSAEELHLSVLSALRAGDTVTADPVSGHGLVGMAERSALVGGRFDATTTGRRFLVQAWLPVPSEAVPRAESAPTEQRR